MTTKTQMIEVGDYVNRKGAEQPVGIVTEVFHRFSVNVRWGIADGKEFIEEIPQDQLESHKKNSINKDTGEVDLGHQSVFNKKTPKNLPPETMQHNK